MGQAASRFGQDGPHRITVAPSMLTEASAVMPFEPVYQPVIPFYPASITNGNGTSTGISTLTASSGDDDWKAYPDKLDLFWWQGDDVTVSLQFPGEEDMSIWTWQADVRYWPSYQTGLHYEFVITAQFSPVTDEAPAHTTVTLFLPRQLNNAVFKGNWELHSLSPYDGPDLTSMPIPPGVDAMDWPPALQLKTWVYGNVTVVPRTNDTDFLPLPQETVITSPTFTVSSFGPNGRTP